MSNNIILDLLVQVYVLVLRDSKSWGLEDPNLFPKAF